MNKTDTFVHFLVESGALKFGNFITKSGRETPYFINTGEFRTGASLSKLAEFYAAAFMKHFDGKATNLYGPAYKGIPLISVTAAALYREHGLRVPVCFNRKEKKDHGEGGVFVGKIPEDGDRIVVIEDVITAGTAIRESMSLLREHGKGIAEAVIIAVDRMEKGPGGESALAELGREFGVKIFPIVTIREVVDLLYNTEINGKKYIDDALYEKIREYQSIYGAG